MNRSLYIWCAVVAVCAVALAGARMWFDKGAEDEQYIVKAGSINTVAHSPITGGYPTVVFHQPSVSAGQSSGSYRLPVTSGRQVSPFAASDARPATTYRPGRSHVQSMAIAGQQPVESGQSVRSYVSGGGAGGNVSVSSNGSSSGIASGTYAATSSAIVAFNGTLASAYTVPFAASTVGGGTTTSEPAGRTKRLVIGEDDDDDIADSSTEIPVSDDDHLYPIGKVPAVFILMLVTGYAIVRRKRLRRNEN